MAVLTINPEAVAKAVKEVREKSKKRKFAQSIDLTINLKELDMKKPENRIDEELALPHGPGKAMKVGVLAEGELALQSKDVADIIIKKDELQKLAKNKKNAKKVANDIDFFVAQVDLMPLIGKSLGPILGPRGKMPKPVPANAPVKPIIERLKKTVRIKTRDQPVIKVVAGIEDMDDKKLAENIDAIIKFVERKLERGKDNMKSVYLKTTMGASVKLGA
ncbi:MAG: 50S ribosomal protein L1 [Candidatus Hydrothermarchaeaceae archaeon]